jgi:hypothetical protein
VTHGHAGSSINPQPPGLSPPTPQAPPPPPPPRLQRLAATVAKHRLPVLILAGANDKLVPSSNAVRLARMLKGSRLAVMQECGHCPQVGCVAVGVGSGGERGRGRQGAAQQMRVVAQLRGQ